jgi:hypothetical protein
MLRMRRAGSRFWAERHQTELSKPPPNTISTNMFSSSNQFFTHLSPPIEGKIQIDFV